MFLEVERETPDPVRCFSVCSPQDLVVRCDVVDGFGLRKGQFQLAVYGHQQLELTSGSIAAALGKKNVGESVWWLTRGSDRSPVKWPRRADNRDFAMDIVTSPEAGDRMKQRVPRASRVGLKVERKEKG